LETGSDHFDKAEKKYRYTRPTMRVDTAEGWYSDFRLTDKFEQELISALSQPFSHVGFDTNDLQAW